MRHSSTGLVRPPRRLFSLKVVIRSWSQSALSSFSAMLLQSLKSINSYFPIAISFFCGNHRKGPLSGPCRLIRSFISQLLSLYPHDSSILTGEMHYIPSPDMESLWNLFTHLITSLPLGVIFCIIDGSGWYPNKPELGSLIMTFQCLADSLNDSIVLKLLLTGPVPKGTRQLVRQNIHVLYDIIDDGQELTERQMYMQR